jgi:uncharacterized membrane protein YkvA (DUF1232 family)
MDFGVWKTKANALKREVYALSLAARDPRVPWYAKVFAAVIIGYALSPIDLIPDFVPVIGYLDDLVFIPVGVLLLIKMIPAEVMEECREKATCDHGRLKGRHWMAAGAIFLIWIISIYIAVKTVAHLFVR